MGFPSEASFFLHPHGIFPGATMRHNRQGRPSWAKSAQARVLLCTGSTWHTIFPVSLPVQWRSTTGRLPGQARSSRDAFVGRRGCVCVLAYLCCACTLYRQHAYLAYYDSSGPGKTEFLERTVFIMMSNYHSMTIISLLKMIIFDKYGLKSLEHNHSCQRSNRQHSYRHHQAILT